MGPKILPMANQWPRKCIKLNNGIALPRSFLRNQKIAPLERAQSGLFTAISPPFGTALVIEKIKFEIFNHIPTWYYRKRLLATTGPAAGIQILEIPTASQGFSNGHNLCYKYPPEVKPSTKWPHRCPVSVFRENWPRRTIIDANLRKTRFWRFRWLFSRWPWARPDFFKFGKNVFSGKIDGERFGFLLLCFPVIYVPGPRFARFALCGENDVWYGLDTRFF